MMFQKEQLKHEIEIEKQKQLDQMKQCRIVSIEPAIRNQVSVTVKFIIINVPEKLPVIIQIYDNSEPKPSEIIAHVENSCVIISFTSPPKTLWVTFDGSENGLVWPFSDSNEIYFKKFLSSCIKNNFEHSLFKSAYEGNLDHLKKIRTSTNIVGAPDSRGFTALSYAILGNKIDAISYLIKECPCIITSTLNNNGVNSLHLAIMCGNIEVIHALLMPFENSVEIINYILSLLRMFTQECYCGNALDIIGNSNISYVELFSIQEKLLNQLKYIDFDNIYYPNFYDSSDSDSPDDNE